LSTTIGRRRVLLCGAAAFSAPLVIGRRSRAAERSITVGIYSGKQGDYVRKEIIPFFEAKHNCKVYTTLGVTLEQVAILGSTRNNPRYSVMFVDDVGVALAKSDGLIEKLPQERIPNMERLLKRFIFNEGYGAAFAMSMASLVYNSQTGKPLSSYAELWDERFRQRFLMYSPKATQSIYLLIAALALETNKPYAEAQYSIEQAWPKMAALKPNVLSVLKTNRRSCRWRRARPTLPACSIPRASIPTPSRARRWICASRGRALSQGSIV
jgi:putative spermidine/putrescine transport system substrate-binding protein